MNQDNKNNEKIDLSDEFKNSDIDTKHTTVNSFYPEAPKMIQWVIKYSGGLAKNKKQASYVLIGFIIIMITIALFSFFNPNNQSLRETKYNPDTKYSGENLPDNFR